MLADLAVVDPDLTLTAPPAVTAATGVDALAHCVEAFTSRKAHPTIDLYALEGIRLVGRFLARAVAYGSDREARAGLSLASLHGGFCLGPVNTTAGHAIAYPLGTRHHIAHAHACALIFPHTLAFNASAAPERTALALQALCHLPRAAPGRPQDLRAGQPHRFKVQCRLACRPAAEPRMVVQTTPHRRTIDSRGCAGSIIRRR